MNGAFVPIRPTRAVCDQAGYRRVLTDCEYLEAIRVGITGFANVKV